MTDILVKKCANGWIVEPLTNSNNVQDDTFVYRTIDGLIQDLPKLLGEGQAVCGFCEKTDQQKIAQPICSVNCSCGGGCFYDSAGNFVKSTGCTIHSPLIK